MFRVSRVWPSAAALLLSVSAASPARARIELISKLPPRYISDTGTAPSEAQAISANGRYAAFLSDATNLVPGQVDTNAGPDVFGGRGPLANPRISANGRIAAFTDRAEPLSGRCSATTARRERW